MQCSCETAKSQRATSSTLQGSVSMLNVKFHETKTRLIWIARRKPPFSKKNTCVKFVSERKTSGTMLFRLKW